MEKESSLQVSNLVACLGLAAGLLALNFSTGLEQLSHLFTDLSPSTVPALWAICLTVCCSGILFRNALKVRCSLIPWIRLSSLPTGPLIFIFITGIYVALLDFGILDYYYASACFLGITLLYLGEEKSGKQLLISLITIFLWSLFVYLTFQKTLSITLPEQSHLNIYIPHENLNTPQKA